MREVGERLPRGAAGGWWVVGGCDVNVSGFYFVSWSTRSLNFPAAKSREQERLCLPGGTRCGLG